MGQYHLKLPKMGESVAEATVTKWLLEVGDTIQLDDPIVEIATDKVDTDVNSEVEGILVEKCFQENEVVQVGETLVIIQTEKEVESSIDFEIPVDEPLEKIENSVPEVAAEPIATGTVEKLEQVMAQAANLMDSNGENGSRFYSPLVRNIAKKEGISLEELKRIEGTGKEKRLTKKDILSYLEKRAQNPSQVSTPTVSPTVMPPAPVTPTPNLGSDSFREMTRMENLIANHMMSSLKTSAHVQSFIEVDVTQLWDWREEVKAAFQARENEKLTFTPLFMSAIIKALGDYPALNSSIDGQKIVTKKEINLGMATALPDGNLIVPVIKNADHLNLVGLAKAVNDLANRARAGQLNPEEVKEGTYTFTNIGQFGSLMGTPIINQPQVGILAIGAIRKMPAVIETPKGDFIGIRRKMILSHSYDHRIINGATGGLFVKRVAEYLENWSETLPY
ncbi:MAG: dihydrolipoamide acetyltransferase family protein [Flavobacteriaceae bacterium]|nr:dihydrolipoamide acetyltransferase family protein [Flavobacteriaceae bacterium]MDG2386418.1 dihydrolipoamide acetyltransferase family protein [Flavobacteriaceae bacterium]